MVEAVVLTVTNVSLTRSTPTPLSVASITGVKGGSIGNYLLFGIVGLLVNGYDSSLTRSIFSGIVEGGYRCARLLDRYLIYYNDAYDASLTRIIVQDLCTVGFSPSGGSVGNYAVFAGGYGQITDGVDVYTVTV